MPQITLSRADVHKLHDFCEAHQLSNFFIAKDQGAYLGASADGDNCIFFFRGCDPHRNPDWYDEVHGKFGGDDFGEFLPLEHLKNCLKSPSMKTMTFHVGKTSIRAVMAG